MADCPPVSRASSPIEESRAWTDSEYFRLLSHELPVGEIKCTTGCSQLEDYEPHYEALCQESTPKAAGDVEPPSPLDLTAGSCSCSPCSSSRASCSSIQTPNACSCSMRFLSASAAAAAKAAAVDAAAAAVDAAAASTNPNPQPLAHEAYEALTERWLAFWRRRGGALCLSCEALNDCCSRPSLECIDSASQQLSSKCCGEQKPQGQPSRSPKQQQQPAAGAAAERRESPRPPVRAKRRLETSASAGSRPDSERARSLPKVTGVRFQAQRNRFVAEWYDQGRTRMAYFPVKQHGFDEARRLAIECRERVLLSKHQRQNSSSKGGASSKRIAEGPTGDASGGPRSPHTPFINEKPSPAKRLCKAQGWESENAEQGGDSSPQPASALLSSPIEAPGEEGPSDEKLLLAQAALNVILIDLLSKCLPSFGGSPQDPNSGAREVVQLLFRQLYSIHTAREYTQLRPYLCIAQESISKGLLPSSSSRQAQVRILMDFLEVAALRS